MRVIIHSPSSMGGIAEHTRYQFLAFQKAGADVALLCAPDFLKDREFPGLTDRVYYCLQKSAPDGDVGALQRLFRFIGNGARFIANQWRLAWEVFVRKPDVVLLDCYMEYLAPLWALPHIILAKLRPTIYVANLHDPVRDFQIGPLWWHKLSVFLAYAPLKVCVVHKHLDDRSVVPPHIDVIEGPVGVYDLSTPCQPASATREQWGAPPSSVIFFSFGFIRDGKNVDLLIRALSAVPEAFLVVMGRVQSAATCKPVSFYERLAKDEGVASRVTIIEQFVPDDMLGTYFHAADVLALTYSASFHSQSGVLNIVARAEKPIIASAGESPLKECVKRFQLGVFVEPDNIDALRTGMRSMCDRVIARRNNDAATAGAAKPDWAGYREYASWDRNARTILRAVTKSESGAAT